MIKNNLNKEEKVLIEEIKIPSQKKTKKFPFKSIKQ